MAVTIPPFGSFRRNIVNALYVRRVVSNWLDSYIGDGHSLWRHGGWLHRSLLWEHRTRGAGHDMLMVVSVWLLLVLLLM